MTTVYVVKSTNVVEGYTTVDVFSSPELARFFAEKISSVNSELGVPPFIEVFGYELDKPDSPFLKPRPFILSYLDDEGAVRYVGIDRTRGVAKAYSSKDKNDANVFPADTSKTLLFVGLESSAYFVNLSVTEV
jgi:hypothetical protein